LWTSPPFAGYSRLSISEIDAVHTSGAP
jgi:hypothetical protein